MSNLLCNKPDLSIVVLLSGPEKIRISDYVNKLLGTQRSSAYSFEVIIGLDGSTYDVLTDMPSMQRGSNFSFMMLYPPKDSNVISKISWMKRELLQNVNGRYVICINERTLPLDVFDVAISKMDTNNLLSGVAYAYFEVDEYGSNIKTKLEESAEEFEFNINSFIEYDSEVDANTIVFRAELLGVLRTQEFSYDDCFPVWLLQHGGLLYIPYRQFSVNASKNTNLLHYFTSIVAKEFLCKNLALSDKFKRIYIANSLRKIPLSIISCVYQEADLTVLRNFSNNQKLTISAYLLSLLRIKSRQIQTVLFGVVKYLSGLYLSQRTYQSYQNDKIPVFYWDQVPNCGDELSRYLVSKLLSNRLKKEILKVPSWKEGKLVTVGSLFNINLLMTKCTYWGTGCLGKEHFFKQELSTNYPLSILNFFIPLNIKRAIYRSRSKVFAVRGPLSRDLLLTVGVKCPKIFGDPALLLPDVYIPRELEKKYFGLVLHHTQLSKIEQTRAFCSNLDGRLIDISCSTNSEIENFVDEVTSCSKVFSSSLHGIIIAQAYGIPAQWVEFKGRPINTEVEFKFKDYFLGAGQIVQKPLELDGLEDLEKYLDFTPPEVLNFPNKQKLLNAFHLAIRDFT